MTPSLNLAQEDTASLLRRYTTAAVEYGRATKAGDNKTVNREYAKIRAVHQALRGRGPDGLKSLLILLNHQDPSVRGWAAAHTLELAPSLAEAKLEALRPPP